MIPRAHRHVQQPLEHAPEPRPTARRVQQSRRNAITEFAATLALDVPELIEQEKYPASRALDDRRPLQRPEPGSLASRHPFCARKRVDEVVIRLMPRLRKA